MFKSFQHHTILNKLCLYTNLECLTNLVTEAQYHNKKDIKEQAIFFSMYKRAVHALIQQKPTNAINYAILPKKN